MKLLIDRLNTSPRQGESLPGVGATLAIPYPNGEYHTFRIEKTTVTQAPSDSESDLVKTYRGTAIDDPSTHARIELSFDGFHALITTPSERFYVDPGKALTGLSYLSYFRELAAPVVTRPTRAPTNPPACVLNDKFKRRDLKSKRKPRAAEPAETPRPIALADDDNLRTYRLALAANSKYVAAVYQPGSSLSKKDQAYVAIIRSVNRVNEIYESELGITFRIVKDDKSIIYDDPSKDPYSNTDANAAIAQNQVNLDKVLGTAQYDIGHLFTTGTAGLASLEAVCDKDRKARGVTGTESPVGDQFDIDYVAHEMGHQFGANHTFNGTHGACAGNRSANTAYEPGSGLTIMAYAGICGDEDLQPHSSPYFHAISLREISDYVSNTSEGYGGSCPALSHTGNHAPIVKAASEHIIPALTPFRLAISNFSDQDNDSVSFVWEEYDLGAPAPPDSDTDKERPVISSAPADRTGLRWIPDLSSWDASTRVLPARERTMRFRVTARDGRGRYATDDSVVNVLPTTKQFKVSTPNQSVTLARNSATSVTWEVAGTNKSPFNCSHVKISFVSLGNPSRVSTLVASTNNSGSATFQIPADLEPGSGRILIEGVEDIFFDLSQAVITVR